jgi:hypothetical protein
MLPKGELVKRLVVIVFALLSMVLSAHGQEPSEEIEDNSFYIEEAFNQEDTVVQHISTGYYDVRTRDFVYTFTQEWPLGGQLHQFSYMIPLLTSENGPMGLGDVLINYRYQLCDNTNWAWIAPRVSLVLPTGRQSRGMGNGVFGLQINFPLSRKLTRKTIVHFNFGGTILPNVKGSISDGTTVEKTLSSVFVGGSGIWLLTENVNLMLELLHSRNAGIDEGGNLEYSTQTIISPGIRCAIDIHDLQIVPGIALPLVIENGNSTGNMFFYLSFEHPF